MNVNDIKLFPHNQDTYDKIQETWKTSNKVASVQATGTGKSYLILKCLYNEVDKNKIVLAPSNYILEQLENEAGESLPNTTLMTYSKLALMNDEEIKDLNLSLIALDEFHRCGADQWGDGIQRLIEAYPNAKILGTSATNIRFLDNNRDMADELFDGNVVTNLSLAEAIIKKIVAMPKYVSALYTFEDEVEALKNKVNNSKNTNEEKDELLKEIDKMKNKLNKSKGIPQILKKHLNINNDKFIIFCKDNIHLNEMKKVVSEWFKKANIFKSIKTYIAYSGYNNTDKEVENFMNNKNRKEVKLLFTIDMFNEGVHIKDISGVILLRPTTSPIIYYQQIGRAMQVGKKSESIILDFVNNFDNIGAKNFISDLKESVKRQKENNDNSNNNTNEKDDDFEFMIFDEIQEVNVLFENIESKLIDSWDVWYNKLKEYYIENGTSNVKTGGIGLANWISEQRKRYRKKELDNYKIKKLNDIEFSWSWVNDKWLIMYELLVEYKNKNNDCLVPINYKIEKYNLGKWVSQQRENKRNNKLSKEQIEKLNQIDFSWNHLEAVWEDMCKALVTYKNKYGDINVPKEYILTNGKDLYVWVQSQKRKCNILSKEKLSKLESIGFVFSKTKDEIWLENYKKYIDFKNKKSNFTPKEKSAMQDWQKIQRRQYKNNKLSIDRIKKLEEIGFTWEFNRTNGMN